MFWELTGIDKLLISNIFSTILYIILIIMALRYGIGGIGFLIVYLIVSAILEFLNISSYLNVFTLLDMLMDLIRDTVNTNLFKLSYYLQIK